MGIQAEGVGIPSPTGGGGMMHSTLGWWVVVRGRPFRVGCTKTAHNPGGHQAAGYSTGFSGFSPGDAAQLASPPTAAIERFS